MRIKSEIWVKAYVRRCFAEGAPALVVRRGQSDAGAIYIKVNLLDGRAAVYGPAPAGLAHDTGDRAWISVLGDQTLPEAEADAFLKRQSDFDPDHWIIEVEDAKGRHFLGAEYVVL